MAAAQQSILPLLFSVEGTVGYSTSGDHQGQPGAVTGVMTDPGNPPSDDTTHGTHVESGVDEVQDLLAVVSQEPGALKCLHASVEWLERIYEAKRSLREVAADDRAAAVRKRMRLITAEGQDE